MGAYGREGGRPMRAVVGRREKCNAIRQHEPVVKPTVYLRFLTPQLKMAEVVH